MSWKYLDFGNPVYYQGGLYGILIRTSGPRTLREEKVYFSLKKFSGPYMLRGI